MASESRHERATMPLPPPLFFRTKFQLAWMKAEPRTSRRATSVMDGRHFTGAPFHDAVAAVALPGKRYFTAWIRVLLGADGHQPLAVVAAAGVARRRGHRALRQG